MLGVPGPFLRRKRGADFVLFCLQARRHALPVLSRRARYPSDETCWGGDPAPESYLLCTTPGQGSGQQGVAFCISYHGWLPAVKKNRI